MDIRSYFGGSQKRKEKEEDDFAIGSRSKKAAKKTRRIVIDTDSEEELAVKKSQKTYDQDKRSSNSKSISKKEKRSVETESARSSSIKKDGKAPEVTKTKRHEVSAADFFGSTEIHRVPAMSAKKSKTPDAQPEREEHSDEEFQKVLQQLDEESVTSTPQEQLTRRVTRMRSGENKTPTELNSSTCEKSDRATPKKKRESPRKPVSSENNGVHDKRGASNGKDSFTKATVDRCDVKPSKPSPSKRSPAKKKQDSSESAKVEKSVETKNARRSPKKEPKISASSAKTPVSEESKANVNKRKSEADVTSPALPDAKKARAANYRSYMQRQREGPSAPGSKEIPEGAEECLAGLSFVLTGVYDSLEREEASRLIIRYGGRVTGSVSSRTKYLVAGEQAGESKTAKAAKLGTAIIDEDGLLDLIRSRSEAMKKGNNSHKPSRAGGSSKTTPSVTSQHKANTPKLGVAASKKEPVISGHTDHAVSAPEASRHTDHTDSELRREENLMWVDKFKPQSMKQLIGQQGDKSNARKLYNWLHKWERNAKLGKHAKGAPQQARFGGSDDGFKAALLSGPPGVGKTSTAQVICKELGLSCIELNASDSRNKKSLETVVMEILQSRSITRYNREPGNTAERGKCLVMDEVDGMAGNEDRGGVQELIQLIKKSKVPIICICNDRNHPKIRSLAFYCLDLRFYKPKLDQIKAALMSIAFKQGVKVPPSALTEIVTAANHDIRQSIHNLSLWTATDGTLSYEQAASDADRAKKDLRLGAFDAARLALSGGEESRRMTLVDKSDLFFQDYSLMPLFVQENYARVYPQSTRDLGEQLRLVMRAADAISQGDMCEALVRRGNWNLLPTQAVLSVVAPGDLVRGTLPGMVNFPAWLGKNSSAGRAHRLAAELRTHVRLSANPDSASLVQHYLPTLRHSLLAPLLRDDSASVPEVLEVLSSYNLLRQDMDSVLELTQWPGKPDAWANVSSKVKAALTRAYNKRSVLTPYSLNAAPAGKKRKAPEAAEWDEHGEEVEESEEEEEADELKNNPMIKARSKAALKKAAKPSGSKGKGKGKKIK